MKFTNFLTKQYLISIFVLVVLTILIIPFPTKSVPEWKILVIDENYLPGANMNVEQKVESLYFGDISIYKATTDKNGFVTFPKRYLWASAASRFMSVFANLFGTDTRTFAQITASEGKCSGGIIGWQSGTDDGEPLPDKLVCP
jgi:hypothetical protein